MTGLPGRFDRRPTVFLPLFLLAFAGCRGALDTSYGRNQSRSVNGTGAFAGLFRSGGHEVRTAYRLSEDLSEWADVIVRFAPQPGPPPKGEAEWYDGWLGGGVGKRLVYVPRDYDATREYWSRALAGLASDAPPRLRERIESARAEAAGWENQLPPHAPAVAPPDRWFSVEGGSNSQVCGRLSGPWAEGVEPTRAGLTRHETLKGAAEEVLLEGDGKRLVVSLDRQDGSRALVVASGTFLLNLPMVEPARSSLAKRVVAWTNLDDDTEAAPTRPRRVAFVEGAFVIGDRRAVPSPLELLQVSPIGRVAAQLVALGLVGCLARAPRIGRPRPLEPSGADRPVAHAEALGALLARTGQSREAGSILDAYRRWRHLGQLPRTDRLRANDDTRLNP